LDFDFPQQAFIRSIKHCLALGKFLMNCFISSFICVPQESYVAHCLSRFGRIINRPSILDAENEEYAEDCCRDVWAARYPSEPFDLECNEIEGNSADSISFEGTGSEILEMVRGYAGLPARFASPFIREGVYHVAAKRRYVRFLDLVRKVTSTTTELARLVPSLDVLLMWLSHQVCMGMNSYYGSIECM
jgi:hypothetical protein